MSDCKRVPDPPVAEGAQRHEHSNRDFYECLGAGEQPVSLPHPGEIEQAYVSLKARSDELERELVDVGRERDEAQKLAQQFYKDVKAWARKSNHEFDRAEQAERKVDMLTEALEHYAIPEGDDGSIRHADGAIARKALASLEER